MRTCPRLAAALLALAASLLCLSANSGRAQVDQRALDQLGPAPGGAAPVAPAPKPRPAAPLATRPLHPNGPHQSLPPLEETPAVAAKPPAKAGALVVPPAPPPVPVLPPPLVVPTRPVPPPPPAPVSADATGVASKLPDGVRVTFGGDHAELNPQTEAALRAVAHDPPANPFATFTVSAYAAGSPEDPSTPRRVSLSRALNVRSVLMSEGIPSVRIYVKALGAATQPSKDEPPDRVDVTVAVPPATAPQTAAPATGTPPAAPAPSQKAAP